MTISDGKKVKINYALTVDGQVIDSATDETPFEYVQGGNDVLPALQKQLDGLQAGDEREIILGPEDAYGPIDVRAYLEIEKSKLPSGEIEVGTILEAKGPDGRRIPVVVSEIREKTVMLDFNHPLAGKELHFKIMILEVS